MATLPCVRAASSDAPSYNRDIRPILSENCFFCHGPDAGKRKAKLRLDVRENALSKKAIVPGDAGQSELVRRIFSADEEEVMPPPKSQKKLTDRQKETLKRWIADGAVYQPQWAYIAPVRPATPNAPEAIDFLVQEKLRESGLKAAPEADRRTLIRRLYFDLIGLPPKPEDVRAFEQNTSSGAYAQLVEQLLASPAYGERMAIGWLDVVRFADTIGYHSDNPRNVWPYRDYVIDSFNRDKPFDQFTREQLAGDLLPESTQEQKVGSAFNRLLLSTEEGGAQPKDYEARMLTDRVRAVGTVWLAQTIGCANCHDHKFDPITQRDFFSMGAFFADIKEPIIGRREDGTLIPDAKQATELAHLEQGVACARQQLETPRPELLASWERAALEAAAAEANWSVLKPEAAVSENRTKLVVEADGIIAAEKDPSHGTDTYRITVRPGLLGVSGLRLEVLPWDKLPAHGPGRGKEGRFVLTEVSVHDAQTNQLELSAAQATAQTAAGPPLAAIDGSVAAGNGWSVSDGLNGVPQAIYFTFSAPVDFDDQTPIAIVLTQNAGSNQVLGRFRLSATADPSALRVPPTINPPADIVELLRATNRTAEQNAKLAAYHRSIAPELAAARRELAAAQETKDKFEATIPRCLVSVSSDTPRTVRILPRGNWMIETGDIVKPALPVYLAGPPKDGEGQRLSRLDLANWLVGRDNPLTARVFVNRLWKQFFGIGLSKVLDDFGAQGEPPSNPALLDWLASEFVASGWDVKHMVRLMVNSHTYRQISTAPKDLLTRDPYNRELARQSRWRLDAELVRDNALRIAGLLSGRIGGPSVKPYQPDGYWENLNFPVRTYEASTGEDQYRRGLYTWWQRSYVHPSLLAFDAPTREECAADRNRSNIPQQALVLLNDPTYVEAARAFAARILYQGGSDTATRLNWAWQQALSRPPRSEEATAVERLLYKDLTAYKAAPESAAALLKVGLAPTPEQTDPAELAAWTNVARVILNLHETITRS